jgi:hypothetical protein
MYNIIIKIYTFNVVYIQIDDVIFIDVLFDVVNVATVDVGDVALVTI